MLVGTGLSLRGWPRVTLETNTQSVWSGAEKGDFPTARDVSQEFAVSDG